MTKDYSTLEEITVKSQDELDDIPEDFKGRIYIEFGTFWNRAVVSKRYKRPVVARGNSSVEAWGNSSVVALGNSSVVATNNAQIVDRQINGRIEITGNSRIVYMPKTIDEYCSFYDIKHDKKKGSFFKCVHKIDGRYYSDHDRNFEYIIGEKAIADRLTDNSNDGCGHGIHMAYKEWVLDFGRNWKDLAILEVEAALDEIILPTDCSGKVRCAEVKVIREIPLEECGLYGKILSKRKKEE